MLCRSLFEWVRDREQKKQELAKMQMNAFKKRYVCSNLVSLCCKSSSGHAQSYNVHVLYQLMYMYCVCNRGLPYVYVWGISPRTVSCIKIMYIIIIHVIVYTLNNNSDFLFILYLHVLYRYQLQDWSGNILSSLQASTKSGLGRRNSDWDNRARLKVRHVHLLY